MSFEESPEARRDRLDAIDRKERIAHMAEERMTRLKSEGYCIYHFALDSQAMLEAYDQLNAALDKAGVNDTEIFDYNGATVVAVSPQAQTRVDLSWAMAQQAKPEAEK